MIRAEHLTYHMAGRLLYGDASFEIPERTHCVLIGANGTGKSTLIDLLIQPDDFLFKGKVIREDIDRVGYVNQFVEREKSREVTACEYLCESFEAMQRRMDELCNELETAEDSEKAMERYQQSLDEFEAVDGYNYEVNILKALHTAGLDNVASVRLSDVSGGEYKLLQIIREMLMAPDLLVMDEPDVFLDFENICGLRELINSYEGTLLVATHNRFLLNHCFDRVLQIEDGSINEFDGSFLDFGLAQLQLKIDSQEQSVKESDFIAYEETVVERMRDDATKHDSLKRGKTLRARVSYVERWKARHIKEPYIESRMPAIRLPDINSETAPEYALRVENYGVDFGEPLLENVSFEIMPGEKVALVGANGTGKTTLLRDIWRGNVAVTVHPDIKTELLSQFHGETLREDMTVWELMDGLGFPNEDEAMRFLFSYCFGEDIMAQPIRTLSGGEKNLLQLARIGLSDASLLLLDEPTSHLDLRSQLALEKAINEYKGAILMVSHDFYSIADCADTVLFAEDGTVRKMSGRAFRKKIYKRHFAQNYLELEQKKKELELSINNMIRANDTAGARAAMPRLEAVTDALQGR